MLNSENGYSFPQNIYSAAKIPFIYLGNKFFKEKTKQTTPNYTHCKNCSEELHGMYCSNCGQYALDINQGFISYIRQFLENTYQFDGKFFQTFRHLLFSPGFLSKEFSLGHINSYVYPMKLYMFMSVIFFSFILLRFTSNDVSENNFNLVAVVNEDNVKENNKTAMINIVRQNDEEKITDIIPDNVTPKAVRNIDTEDLGFFEGLKKLEGIKHLDSKQVNTLNKEIMGYITQYIPLIFLILIPLYGAFLKLSFRKKTYVYMHNIVFAFHQHTLFLFLLSFFMILERFISYDTGWILFALFFIYHILSVKKFYEAGWISSVLKSLMTLSVYSFILLIVIIFLTVIMANKIGNDYAAGLI